MGIAFSDVNNVLYDRGSGDSVRIQTLEKIITDFPNDPLLPDILIQAMMEGSPSISAHARTSFSKLVHGTDPKRKQLLLTKALGKLFALDSNNKNFSDSFSILAPVIIKERHEWPHIYIRFIQESHKQLQLQLSDHAAQTIQKFLEDLSQKSDDDFKPIIRRIRNRRLKQNLVSLSIPPSTILSTLGIFRDRRLEDLTLEELISHLHPLKHRHDPEIIHAVLKNLQSWVKDFPLRYENPAPLDVLIHFRDSENEDFELDPGLQNQLIITSLFPKELFRLLNLFKNEKYYPRVVETVFRTFHRVPGNRDLAPVVCQFIRKYPLQDQTLMAAVDYLAGMLTCHIEYPRTNVRRTTDHYRRIFLVERELLPDREIRSMLHKLAYRMDVLPHIRKHAFHVLLKSRPPDLLEILREGNIDAISDNPLLQARLEATAELKELDYTDIIRKIWEAPKGATFRSELIDVLASLGHREIVNILLPASFDTTYRDVGQKAKEALQNTGYSAEIEREEERLHLLDLSVEQERAILKLSSLSEDLKAVNADIHDLNAELINCRSSSVRILSQLLHSDIYLRVKGSEAALMLAVEFRTLNEIRAQIAPIEQEIRVLIRLINVQIGIANALFARIIQVENEMDECERGIQQCESDIAYYSSQIRNAENREWSARSELNSLSPPSWYGGSQNDREAYNSALRNYQYAVSRCEQEIQSAQAEASAAWSRRARAESQLSTYQSRLATLERQYHALGIELAAVESQIAGFTVRLNGLRRQLADLQEQFRACEARIDAIQESIKNFIRQTRDEQDRLTSHRRELSDHQTSLSHQITQAHNRRIRISQMIPMAKQEINTVGTRITAAKQNFEQTAFRVLHETFIADEAAVENSKTLRSNQEIADKLFWRIDWTIRNTLGSDSFRGQYGKTIAHMVTEIKRRKTV